jgi:hypothetical protein
MARRTSSGSTSIVTTTSTSHRLRISQQSLGDDASAQLNKILTSIVGTCEIVCHQRTFEILIYWDQ